MYGSNSQNLSFNELNKYNISFNKKPAVNQNVYSGFLKKIKKERKK